MKTLKPPVNFRPLEVASFQVRIEWLIERLGEAHYVESDCTRTHGGINYVWAFELEDDSQFLIEFRESYGEAVIASSIENPNEVLTAIGVEKNNSIKIYEKAYIWK